MLLRVSAAIAVLATPEITAAEAPRWAVTLFAALLILGLWTRVAMVLCLGLLLSALPNGADPVESGARILQAVAIILLGPGAYSADSMVFGRRTIILGKGSD